MGQFFDSIPGWLIPWIDAQKIFWVATAPLAEDGHVNVSPKGCFDKTLNIVLDEESSTEEGKKTSSAVWYEDLTGSGVETISHLRENGRITLMLTAFEGPPRIARLFGTGKVYEFGTPEYNQLLPPDRRQPGSRAVIWIDVHKVGTSCGYSIPFFEFKAPRVRLHQFFVPREKSDMEHEADAENECPPPPSYHSATASSSAGGGDIPSDSVALVTPPGESTVLPPPDASSPRNETEPKPTLKTKKEKQLSEKGIKYYWKNRNFKSIDGLPGLEFAYTSEETPGRFSITGQVYAGLVDDESEKGRVGGAAIKASGSVGKEQGEGEKARATENLVVGFGLGVLVGVVLSRWKIL